MPLSLIRAKISAFVNQVSTFDPFPISIILAFLVVEVGVDSWVYGFRVLVCSVSGSRYLQVFLNFWA